MIPETWRQRLPLLSAETSSDLRLLQSAALVVLLIALILPASGLGFTICGFYNLTGIACAGCGLTRSVTNAVHGDFTQAFYFHPLGLFFAGAAVVLALSAAIAPLSRWIDRRRRPLSRLLWIATVAVLLFGTLRTALILVAPEKLGPFGVVQQERPLMRLPLWPFGAR